MWFLSEAAQNFGVFERQSREAKEEVDTATVFSKKATRLKVTVSLMKTEMLFLL